MGGIFTFRVIGLGENPKRNYPMIFTLSQTHCTYKNVIRTGFKDFTCGLRIRVIFIFHFDAVVGYFKNTRRAGHISIKLEWFQLKTKTNQNCQCCFIFHTTLIRLLNLRYFSLFKLTEYVSLAVNAIRIIVSFTNSISENDSNYKHADILIVIWDICA